MNLDLVRSELPIGFFHRVVAEMSTYSKRKVVWKDGLCAKGWLCDVFVDGANADPMRSGLSSLCRVTFKVRTRKVAQTDAITELSILYDLCQRVMSFYTGILCTITTPCSRCRMFSFNVSDCLNKTKRALEEMKCHSCFHSDGRPRTAADVFPTRGGLC